MAKMTKATLLRYLEEHKESLEGAVRNAIYECRDGMILNGWDYSHAARVTDAYTKDDDGKMFRVCAPIYVRVERDSVDYSRMVASWFIAGEDIPYEPRELAMEFNVKGEGFDRRECLRNELKALLDEVQEKIGAVTEDDDDDRMLEELDWLIENLPLDKKAIKEAVAAYRRKK